MCVRHIDVSNPRSLIGHKVIVDINNVPVNVHNSYSFVRYFLNGRPHPKRAKIVSFNSIDSILLKDF